MVRMDLEELKKLKRGMEEERNKLRVIRTIRRGDIYWCDLGDAKSKDDNGIKEEGEQAGKRPCLIVQNDIGNKYSPTVIVIPISSKIEKCKQPTHTLITKEDCQSLYKDSYLVGEQINTITKNKLGDYIGHVMNDKIIKAMKISLGLQRITTEKEDVLINKVKHLKELEIMISMMLDKSNNIITDFIKQFVDDRHNLLLDIKEYCNRNNMNLHYYYKKEEYIKIAI